MKSFKQFAENVVPVNSAGAGNVPGIGIGPEGEPPVGGRMFRRKPPVSTTTRRKKRKDESSN